MPRAREGLRVSRRRSRIPGSTSPSRTTLYVLPGIPDDAPEELKNGIALRNLCATQGRCPSCGAIGAVQPADDEHELVYHYTFLHLPGCCVPTDAEVA